MIPSKEEMYQALKERHGAELQAKFQNAKVAVLGIGGLGSNIAIALARAGVGYLHLIDFDKVDITNLNRQQYFVHQLGQYKTEALSENLKQIAPYCQVETTTIKVTKDDIKELLKNEDIICEAFDSAEAKAMLVEGVLEQFPEKYVVSGSGMAGLSSANTIKTRKVLSHFYLCGDEVSDIKDGLGLFSSRVMVCAAQEANMVLRIIAGEFEP